MAQHPWLDPQPFWFEGDDVGCLLVHGFTGAPPEMRPMGEYLADKGYSVLGVRLAGHGTTPQELARTRWQDWAESVQEGWERLRGRCRCVVLGGLSLGGLLCLHHAARQPVDGLILMAPGLIVRDWRLQLVPLVRWVKAYEMRQPGEEGRDLFDPEAVSRIWCYDRKPLAAAHELLRLQRRVRRLLPQVTCPTLIFQGRQDGSVLPRSAETILRQIRSPQKELVWLERSGHCLTVDAEREAVWQRSAQFIQTVGEAALA